MKFLLILTTCYVGVKGCIPCPVVEGVDEWNCGGNGKVCCKQNTHRTLPSPSPFLCDPFSTACLPGQMYTSVWLAPYSVLIVTMARPNLHHTNMATNNNKAFLPPISPQTRLISRQKKPAAEPDLVVMHCAGATVTSARLLKREAGRMELNCMTFSAALRPQPPQPQQPRRLPSLPAETLARRKSSPPCMIECVH